MKRGKEPKILVYTKPNTKTIFMPKEGSPEDKSIVIKRIPKVEQMWEAMDRLPFIIVDARRLSQTDIRIIQSKVKSNEPYDDYIW